MLTEDEWSEYIREHIPALNKLYNAGKFEQFEQYKTLSDLTWEHYVNSYYSTWDNHFQIPTIHRTITKSISSIVVDVQPMSAPAGGIFSINCQNNH